MLKVLREVLQVASEGPRKDAGSSGWFFSCVLRVARKQIASVIRVKVRGLPQFGRFGRRVNATEPLNACLGSITMEVCIFTRISVWFRVNLTNSRLGTGTRQLIHRCGGHLHHICTGPQEENESMGAYDRTLCFWGEDPGKIQIPIPR
jgi:hypothetical protein